MRCTGAPQTGHGCLNRPWTAISSRNAVTFSGNAPPPAVAQALDPRRSVARIASYSRAISSSVSERVSFSGDSRAAWRISSEYALPMPLNEMRIGERALERVVLARQRLAECRERRLERFDAAGIERRERRFAPHQLHRCALLRARFREEQRAVLELEHREHQLRSDARLLARLAPAQAPRDHQMEDEEEMFVPETRARCACRCGARRARRGRAPTRSADRPIAARMG